MKKSIAVLLAVALAIPAAANARPGPGGWHGGYYGGHGWGWSGDWVVPALVGGVILYDLSQPRTVYVDPAPPVYSVPLAAPAVQYWYWCAAANAYYPYVSSCPSGWQAVPATPPAVPR